MEGSGSEWVSDFDSGRMEGVIKDRDGGIGGSVAQSGVLKRLCFHGTEMILCRSVGLYIQTLRALCGKTA